MRTKIKSLNVCIAVLTSVIALLTIGMIVLTSITLVQKKDAEIIANDDECCDDDYVVFYKPVIYLYGYEDEVVNVKLDITDGEFTCTYPEYTENGWNVTASKDGTLTDKNGLEYYSLYWEANINAEFDFSKGFCVSGSNTADFLDTKLEELGLNRREIDEFIIYWLPAMQNNPYNVISFQTKTYSQAARLTVTPKPNKMIRVFMTWYASDEYVEMEPQYFSVPNRVGKVVVEWGGSRLDNNAMIDYEDESLEEDSEKAKEIEKELDSIMKSQEELKELQNLTEPVAEPIAAIPPVPAGHSFTDKNGQTAVFTDAEWQKLLNTWAFTGQAEEMITHHTLGELQAVLAN